jgi:diaminohydroxyphosphoribosylaminopyrimidine deaminase/5-amino-6-(5-phosphoribosylamino)uracil reductase
MVDLEDLVSRLGNLGILSVLVEGGGRIHGAFAQKKLADRLFLFVAPKVLGSGINWLSFEGVTSIADGLPLRDIKAIPSGEDLLIRANFASKSS